MATQYEVKIVRTITTVVAVDAQSAFDARCLVLAYGGIEAVNDFPVRSEDVQVKVLTVKQRGKA